MMTAINQAEVRTWMVEFYNDVGDDSRTPDEFSDATIQMIYRLQGVRDTSHLLVGKKVVNDELEALWYTLRDLSPRTVAFLKSISGKDPVGDLMFYTQTEYKMPRKDTTLRLSVLSQATHVFEDFGIDYTGSDVKNSLLVEYLKKLIEVMGLPYDAYVLARDYPKLKAAI